MADEGEQREVRLSLIAMIQAFEEARRKGEKISWAKIVIRAYANKKKLELIPPTELQKQLKP